MATGGRRGDRRHHAPGEGWGPRGTLSEWAGPAGRGGASRGARGGAAEGAGGVLPIQPVRAAAGGGRPRRGVLDARWPSPSGTARSERSEAGGRGSERASGRAADRRSSSAGGKHQEPGKPRQAHGSALPHLRGPRRGSPETGAPPGATTRARLLGEKAQAPPPPPPGRLPPPPGPPWEEAPVRPGARAPVRPVFLRGEPGQRPWTGAGGVPPERDVRCCRRRRPRLPPGLQDRAAGAGGGAAADRAP